MNGVDASDDRRAIAILGAGRVGTALGVLARRHGYDVTAIAGRSDEHLRESARRIGGAVRIASPSEAVSRAGLVFITAPDDAIESLCASLAEQGAFCAKSTVAHCSGVLTSDVLESARSSAGCRVASFHPLQTFPDVDAALDELPGSHCFIEGDEVAVEILTSFGSDLGLTCVPIERDAKILYHAAAVVACNDLTTLLDAALTLGEGAGIDREVGWRALESLVTATLANVGREGPMAALTGPIARGDIETIRLHLQALATQDARLDGLYRSLGRWTVDLARRKGGINEARARELDALLCDVDDQS